MAVMVAILSMGAGSNGSQSRPAARSSAEGKTTASVQRDPSDASLPILPSNTKTEEQLLSAAGKGFRLKRTGHFVVATDVPDPIVKHLITRLETTYYAIHQFCRVNRIPIQVSSGKLEVVFYDRLTDYQREARKLGVDPRGTYGFYCQPWNRSVFYNIENDAQMVRLRDQVMQSRHNLEHAERVVANLPRDVDGVRLSYPDGRTVTMSAREAQEELAGNRLKLRQLENRLARYAEQFNESVIQHEAAHHVLFVGGVLVREASTPLWLTEGLAMQFEAPPSKVGRTPTMISPYRLDEYHRAYQEGKLRNVRFVLSVRNVMTDNTNQRAIYYAQAWALVYYLRKVQPERFAAYVKALGTRRPGVAVAFEQEWAEFEEYFGPPDEAFAQRWMKHILALPYRPGEVGP